jgi:hypothetical protein
MKRRKRRTYGGDLKRGILGKDCKERTEVGTQRKDLEVHDYGTRRQDPGVQGALGIHWNAWGRGVPHLNLGRRDYDDDCDHEFLLQAWVSPPLSPA